MPADSVERGRLFLGKGNRVDTIEEIRGGSGIALSEARDFVDAWLDGHR